MACPHLSAIEVTEPSTTAGCEDCLEIGGQWVHLRLCMGCGHVGCCDSSPNTHATRHHESAGHPVVQSFEPGEFWAWCFEDRAMIEAVAPELRRSYA